MTTFISLTILYLRTVAHFYHNLIFKLNKRLICSSQLCLVEKKNYDVIFSSFYEIHPDFISRAVGGFYDVS